MFSSLIAKFKIYLIFAGIIVSLCTAFYFYFDYSQTKIEKLNQDISTYKSTVEEQTKTIEKLTKSFDEAKAKLSQLNKDYAKINNDNKNLKQKFDISTVTVKTKKEIETKTNTATNELFNELMEKTQLDQFEIKKHEK